MLPALTHGQLVLGWRWGKPRVGNIVVARVKDRLIIKRVARIDPDGIWILGDNTQASTDSRQFGSIKLEQIEAVVLARSQT